jgi:hypothetical protein
VLENEKERVAKQMENILAMDDFGYEALKGVILSAKSNLNIDGVMSIFEEDDYSDIEDGQEYAKAKEELKKNSTLPKRTVDGIEMGDTSFFENGGLKNFKPVIGTFGEDSSSGGKQAESRSLSANKKDHKAIEKKSQLDFSGFEGIQGLTKPINIPNKEHTIGTKYSDLLTGLNWTTKSGR